MWYLTPFSSRLHTALTVLGWCIIAASLFYFFCRHISSHAPASRSRRARRARITDADRLRIALQIAQMCELQMRYGEGGLDTLVLTGAYQQFVTCLTEWAVHGIGVCELDVRRCDVGLVEARLQLGRCAPQPRGDRSATAMLRDPFAYGEGVLCC